VHNLPSPSVSISEVVETIAEVAPGAEVGYEDTRLPFPEDTDAASFTEVVPGFTATSLVEGVRATVERFRSLLADGRISPPTT